MEVLSFASTAHDEFLGAAPSAMNMLEEFNFDDICVDFNDKGVLPDLAEVDFADFLFEGNSEIGKAEENRDNGSVERNENKEIISSVDVSTANSPSPELANKEVKKSKLGNGKGSHGKRKVKVDWTPELHRKFVQAVEQLDIDKAVPSRILEIMGIDGLTRHNIASHLQKYRSQRKHMMAREAEAASWSQRRHLSSSTVCIPHPHPQAVPFHHVPFRPLHVWGHPAWAPSPWHHAAVTLGTPCFPRPLLPPQVRFSPPLAVPRIPPPPPPPPAPHPLMYRPADVSGSTPVQPVHPNNKKLASQLQILDASPTKESIDEVIGDALAKPWLRLPLGLKPPSLDSVLVELHKQGISTVPPTNG